jgi:hypothetical protein
MEATPNERTLTVFRRRRQTDDLDDLDDFDDEDGADYDDLDEHDGDVIYDDDYVKDVVDPSPRFDQAPYAVDASRPRPTGPWDAHDIPDDEVPRLDLGGILVPVPEGIELRVEVADDVPVAATLVDGRTQLQIHAFAAPKSSGLWDEVRSEIAQSLAGSGGSSSDADGPFGTELRARIPAETGGTQPARFLGVDGPRWFLRGLMTGAGSTDPTQAKRLEEAFRQVVVNRGGEAMAPRDMIPLHLPREALEVGPPPPPEPQRRLTLPERGPEITEIQ